MTGFSPSVMDVLRQVAPVIGGAIGTAVAPGIGTAAGGMLANVAVEALGKSLGVPPVPAIINREIEDHLRVINDKSNGEAAILKQADLNLKLHEAQDATLAKIAADLELGRQKLANEDTANARSTFTEHKDYVQKSIGLMIVAGFLACVGFILSGRLTLTDPNMLILAGTLVGYLSAKSDTVLNFYYGSSLGSKRSADSLRNIAEGK